MRPQNITIIIICKACTGDSIKLYAGAGLDELQLASSAFAPSYIFFFLV